MSIRLGVDLGTTWTAAAVSEGRAEVLQLGTHGLAMPSVVALDGDTWVAGEAAERRLAADPSGGAREVKRRLGDTTPIVVGGKPFGAEALMAPLLTQAIATATERGGAAPASVTLTHPANWGEYKLDLLREVGRLAGRDDVDLMSEPAAAALHYAQLGRIAAGDTVAVYDFGGGTFDVAVVRYDGDRAEILGTPNGLERLGGVDLDQIILVHVDSALDGKLREVDTTQPDVRSAIAALRASCTSAKEALSSDSDASITVALPELRTEVRITRAEFETAVRSRIQDTIGAFDRAVTSAGVAVGDLAGVLLVGGSARIPVVSEILAEHTGRPLLVDADAKAVVALGAAGSSAGAAVPTAAAAAAGTGAARRERSAAARRGDRGSSVLGAAAATAAAGGAVAAGVFGYSRLTGDDGGDSGDDAAAAEGSADQPVADDSMDAFDDLAGPAGAGGGGGGAASLLGGGVPAFSGSPAGRVASRVFADSPDGGDGGGFPRVGAPVAAAVAGAGSPTTGALFGDPALEQTRAQLQERLEAWSAPAGADPEAFAEVKADLDALLDRFHAYPGQSVDDAIASLRYQFEDRVHDFAQDQKLDALLDEREAEIAAEEALDQEVESLREQLRDRLDGWQAPEGADPDAVADMKADLEGILDRFTPIPGQSADDALADLRARFNDRVTDFAQDQKLDAVIDDLKAEPETPADEPTGTETTPPETVEPEPGAEEGAPSEPGDEVPPEPGDEPAETAGSPETTATDDAPSTDMAARQGGIRDTFEELIAADEPAAAGADPVAAGVGDPPPPGVEETLARPPAEVVADDDVLGTSAVTAAVAASSPAEAEHEAARPEAAPADAVTMGADDLAPVPDLPLETEPEMAAADALGDDIGVDSDELDDFTATDDDMAELEHDPTLDDPVG
jgi:actin-like ATPase involved in cell morphogenesis